MCSTVNGTGLTLDACGAADVVVELLLTSLCFVWVSCGKTARRREATKGCTFLWVVNVRIGPQLAFIQPPPPVCVPENGATNTEAKARRLGYSRLAAPVSVSTEFPAAEIRGLGSQGPSSTWRFLGWIRGVNLEFKLACLLWFSTMALLLRYWVQLEETRSNDNCPTVMCNMTNVSARCVYAWLPKCSHQVNFNH